jgi:hypothetical protein
LIEMAIRSIPLVVDGHTFRRNTPAGTVRVVVNAVEGDPFEVFVLLGRAGSEAQSFCEALGRVVSLYLRAPEGLSPADRLAQIAEQLQGIGGAHQVGFGPHRVLSVVDAVGRILAEAGAPPAAGSAAAARPEAVDINGVDPSALARERNVLAEQARASGKPEAIIEKMVEGRIRKYYEEVVLLEQVWVHDGESRVRAVLAKAGAKAAGFARFQLGEGIERQGSDFAAEVAAAAGAASEGAKAS